MTRAPREKARLDAERAASPSDAHVRRPTGVLIAVVFASTVLMAALVAAGCGSGGSGTTTSHGRRRTATVSKRAHRKRSGVVVGAAQRVHAGGSQLSVMVSRVIDPLRDSGAALPPGERAVGVLVSILNHGPGIYDSSSTTDISLASSRGPGTAVFASRGACATPLRNFDNEISAGESRAGCVAFAVSHGARVTAVRFSPHGEAARRVSWRVG
jgi:hypothetical protein